MQVSKSIMRVLDFIFAPAHPVSAATVQAAKARIEAPTDTYAPAKASAASSIRAHINVARDQLETALQYQEKFGSSPQAEVFISQKIEEIQSAYALLSTTK